MEYIVRGRLTSGIGDNDVGIPKNEALEIGQMEAGGAERGDAVLNVAEIWVTDGRSERPHADNSAIPEIGLQVLCRVMLQLDEIHYGQIVFHWKRKRRVDKPPGEE